MEKKNETPAVRTVALMSNSIQIIDREGNINVFPLSVVTLSLDDAGAACLLRLMAGASSVYAGKFSVTSYSQEIPGVIYVDRPIRICPCDDAACSSTHLGAGMVWEVSAV